MHSFYTVHKFKFIVSFFLKIEFTLQYINKAALLFNFGG